MHITKSINQNLKKSAHILRREGPAVFTYKAARKFKHSAQKISHRKIQTHFLAKSEDIIKASWATNPYEPVKLKTKPPFVINWVMSPPGRGSGGHQNIFRFIAFLEKQGHVCRIYLYSANHFPSKDEIRDVLSSSYPKVSATIEWINGPMEPANAVFATGWETAYPVFNDPGKARKFYFVQDFEPYFYSIGSEYIFAENTYRMNFYGITAGKWLAHRLNRDYGMMTDNYDFGTDTNMYKFSNREKRKEIFFYARPVTARRGFELGLMALQIFHKKMPEYTVNFAGWDVSEYDIPFPYKNLKTMPLNELSQVYNKCAVGLVISLTNMSLLPLELLAAGTIPVVTDGPNNTEVSKNQFIEYAHPSPDALAKAMIDIVTKNDLPAYAEKASKSVETMSWEHSGQQFEQILKRELDA